MDSRPEQTVIPLVEEQAHFDVRRVECERVRVRKRIETSETIVEREVCDEQLEIERVQIGREVACVPVVREEDGVLIVPVVAEELVVRARLILKEELHVRRRQNRRTAREPVRLRREVAEIERMPVESAQRRQATEGGQNDGSE